MYTGFDAAILTTVNIFPEYAVRIYDSIFSDNLREAREAQTKLTQRIFDITKKGQLDFFEAMKSEFNKVNSTFKCGAWRKTATFKNA